MKRVLTFGTYDVFHVGHVNILERAKELGDKLIVGVSSDDMNFDKKARYPVYREEHRMQLVESLYCVDEVFVERSLDLKRQYLIEQKADVLVMGDDWEGKFDEFRDICEVVYFPRTEGVSTTDIIQMIQDRLD